MPDHTDVRQRRGSFVLDRPAIELAVCEVRFGSGPERVGIEDGLALREAVRAAGQAFDGTLEPLIARTVAFTANGEQSDTATSQVSGVRLTDASSGLEITLMPTAIAVHSTRYTRWSSSLRPVLEAALAEVAERFRPQLRTRVGLRYVNRFVDPEAHTPAAWGHRFAEPVALALSDGPFASRVRGAHQQFDLVLGDHIAATVRHGCFHDSAVRNAYSYLLDLDVYSDVSEVFSADETLMVAEELNREAAELFRSLLAPSYAEQLGMHGVPTATKDDA